MRIKYNRTSTVSQDGERFKLDTSNYDLVLFDRGVSGKIPFMDRPQAKELIRLVEEGRVEEVVVEELSRLGRNTGDCINTLEWFEEKEINVVVLSNGLQSRPNGKKNPLWKVITSIFSSVYEMELENIKERTMAGRKMYVMNGGKLGKPIGATETVKQFLSKDKPSQIIKLLKRDMSFSEIMAITGASKGTISKVKKLVKV